MSRYIDIDKQVYCGIDGDYERYNIDPNAPNIEIVRCEECRYCKKKRGTFKGEPIIFYRCTENNQDVEADDFCSWGERNCSEKPNKSERSSE